MPTLTPQQKLIVLAILALIVIVVLMAFCIVPGFKHCGKTTQSAELTIWGVYDGSDVWDSLIPVIRARYPNVSITYKEIPFDEYEDDLLDAFAAKRGPDIFYIHHSWLPKFIDKVTPMPNGEGWPTFREYRDAFVDVVADDFTRDRSTIYAVPLYMDALALYYNRDLLNAAGIAEPPATWEEFQGDVERLTIVDASGNIVRSGAAMGTARNINRSTDIFSLLLLQTFGDTPLTDPSTKEVNLTKGVQREGQTFSPGVDALRFYTDFANPTVRSYTWNSERPYSIDAFVEGSTAMMLNYSHHVKTIRARAPQLRFGIARAPQPAELVAQKRAIDYANYFGLAVAKLDDPKRAAIAWRVLTVFMDASAQKAYANATGLLPARRDLLAAYGNDPDFSVFAQAALTARSWYQPDSTEVERIFADMIESVVAGTATVHEALSRADGQISVLFTKVPEGSSP